MSSSFCEPTSASLIVRGDEYAGAEFSSDGLYRYRLWRTFNRLPFATAKPRFVAFVSLNPSVADHEKLDPTLRRDEAFAKRWGYDGVILANMFALCSTDPRGLLDVADPIGPENDAAIRRVVGDASLVVCAWGSCAAGGVWWKSGGGLAQRIRVRALLESISEPHCLGFTKDGHPKHPLYLPGGTVPELWFPARESEARP